MPMEVYKLDDTVQSLARQLDGSREQITEAVINRKVRRGDDPPPRLDWGLQIHAVQDHGRAPPRSGCWFREQRTGVG